MSAGIRVWDADGRVVFDDEFLAMRVLGVLTVRDPTLRYTPMDIATPLAGAGVIPMVMPAADAYHLGWSGEHGDTHLAEMPIVTVHQGFVRLQPFNAGYKSSAYRANVDIALVKTE